MQGVLFLTQRHLRHLAVPLQRQQRVAVPVDRVVAEELAPDDDELTLDAIFLISGAHAYTKNARAAHCAEISA